MFKKIKNVGVGYSEVIQLIASLLHVGKTKRDEIQDGAADDIYETLHDVDEELEKKTDKLVDEYFLDQWIGPSINESEKETYIDHAKKERIIEQNEDN